MNSAPPGSWYRNIYLHKLAYSIIIQLYFVVFIEAIYVWVLYSEYSSIVVFRYDVNACQRVDRRELRDGKTRADNIYEGAPNGYEIKSYGA